MDECVTKAIIEKQTVKSGIVVAYQKLLYFDEKAADVVVVMV